MFLKVLACLLLIFHYIALFMAPLLSPGAYFAFAMPGALAFPLLTYLMVSGAVRSRNVFRYFIRLFATAVVTQLILLLFQRIWPDTGMEFRNGLFTIALGLLFMIGLETLRRGFPDLMATKRRAPAGAGSTMRPDFVERIPLFGLTLSRRGAIALGSACIVMSILLCIFLEAEYGYYGLCLCVFFAVADEEYPGDPKTSAEDRPSWPGTHEEWRPYARLFLVMLALQILLFAQTALRGTKIEIVYPQLFGLFAVPLFPLAHAQRRLSRASQYAFYAFYPVLILILSLLRHFLFVT